MSKAIVTVKPNIVKAMTHFAAKSDIRYYLNGILVEFVGSDAFLVATNGHRLAAFRGSADAPVDKPRLAIVPNELFRYVDAKRSAQPVAIHVDDDDTVGVTQGHVTMSAKAIPGIFPNWRKVVPSTLSGELAQFNPALLADIRTVTRLVHGSDGYPHIRHNGQGAALVDIGDENFVIVVMPFRHDDKPFKTPDWALSKESEPTSEVEAVA
ncbi:hypothetical protein [Pandoraea commovens]|uniref:Beta sliding clamp n=1 Tax=Pandoraea commovens TaxID=2508289 RepID=A0A5E4SGQ6_9BURK|nr:hypothetical protein [Pandoraea commovens]VVD75116.1 DNA polymerase III subunit beta [Pandoraea commovens]